MLNDISLDTLCAALAYAMGIEKPHLAADADVRLCDYVDRILGTKKVDKLFMYNPDAIAEWVYKKYPELCREAKSHSDIELPYRTVMPSVTPVCFGTMYTGTQPEVHGIKTYAKPVIKIDTLFDSLIRAGKRIAIVGDTNCSMSNIYLERDIDYFKYDTEAEINAKAVELILEDRHDVIVIYNGNYDTQMHKSGPESIEALSDLRINSHIFAEFCELIKARYKKYNTLVGFAMDHGCHEIDGSCGSHGLDMEEDLNIVHLYKIYPKAN
ncbi:MAG: alkaline phosphatase family protein [Clostridia bacterium]|nr:alkaline phosphatase family protein [Clostridia bacterium]